MNILKKEEIWRAREMIGPDEEAELHFKVVEPGQRLEFRESKEKAVSNGSK